MFSKTRLMFLLAFAFCALHAAEAGVEKLRSPFEKKAEKAMRTAPPDAPRTDGSVHLLGGIAPHHDLALPMIVRFYRRLAEASEAGRDVRRV